MVDLCNLINQFLLSHQMSSSDTAADSGRFEERLQNAGIERTSSGHFRLRPVLITRPGSHEQPQMITIEVGDLLPQDQDNQRVFTLQQFLSSFGPASPAAAVPAAATATAEQPQSRPMTRQTGIRGLDYPAFDVSREGIYNDPSQPTSGTTARQHVASIPVRRLIDTIASALPQNSTEASPATTSQANGNPSRSVSSASSTSSDSIEPRNIILTVNYIYGSQRDINGRSSNVPNTGLLILNIPVFQESSQSNIDTLVRLATSIALRTIRSILKKTWGVSRNTFDDLKIRHLRDLKDTELECAICYDKFEDDGKDSNDTEGSKKRKRGDGEEDDGADNNDEDDNDNNNTSAEHSAKKSKNNDQSATTTATTATTAATATTATAQTEPATGVNNAEPSNNAPKRSPETIDPTVYHHYPVELTCGHIFGQSCLAEWFKANNSCPLCRSRLPTIGNSGVANQTTVTLPNLSTVINTARSLIDDFDRRNLTIIVPDETSEQTQQAQTQQQPTQPQPQQQTNQAIPIDLSRRIVGEDARNAIGNLAAQVLLDAMTGRDPSPIIVHDTSNDNRTNTGTGDNNIDANGNINESNQREQ